MFLDLGWESVDFYVSEHNNTAVFCAQTSVAGTDSKLLSVNRGEILQTTKPNREASFICQVIWWNLIVHGPGWDFDFIKNSNT
jgi:hypothetical protein